MKAINNFVLYLVTLFIVWAFIMVVVTEANAGNSFNFGQDTYQKVGSKLVVNSLGDKGLESSDGAFGYNDYIPENAFKNNMKEQGYSAVYDSKPADGRGYTAVNYMGRLGDPRAEDVDYVLTSEYLGLNNSSQNDRINANAARMDDLDKTQCKVALEARLYDAKYYSVTTYAEYNFGSQKVDEVGIKIQLKLTQSYESRQLEKLEARIKRLERK